MCTHRVNAPEPSDTVNPFGQPQDPAIVHTEFRPATTVHPARTVRRCNTGY